jgi:hypothetical protein
VQGDILNQNNMKILLSEPIATEGIDILHQCAEVDIKPSLYPEQLQSIIGDYDALIVRSQTKVTSNIIDTGHRLQVIGKAGVGIDNIEVGENIYDTVSLHRALNYLTLPKVLEQWKDHKRKEVCKNVIIRHRQIHLRASRWVGEVS